MESLEKGISPVRAVRIPDSLWDRLTEWAQHSGIGNADALRALLALGLECPPEVRVRPLMTWMVPNNPGDAFAHIPPGADWWDLDDLVGQLPGVKRYARRNRSGSQVWWSVPASQVATLREIFAGRAERLRLHA